MVGKKDSLDLKIVNFTILKDLLCLIPENEIKQYLKNYFYDVPDVKDYRFGPWLRKIRKEELNLTQKKLAAKLSQQNSKLKIYASDIGNLETGKRLHNYREKRLELFKRTLLELRQGEGTTLD